MFFRKDIPKDNLERIYKRYLEELEGLCDKYSKEYETNRAGMKVLFRTKEIDPDTGRRMKTGKGETLAFVNLSGAVVTIGKSGFFDGDVKKNFAMCVISLFHELTHVEQYIAIKGETAPKESVYDTVSGFYNPTYDNKNYYIRWGEVDADIEGIKRGYRYIVTHHKEFVHPKRETPLLTYIKEYMLNNGRYVDYKQEIETAQSMREIEERVFIPLKENLWQKGKDIDGCEGDEFVTYLRENGGALGTSLEEVLSLTKEAMSANGVNKNSLPDKVLTAIALDRQPELRNELNLFNLKEFTLESVMEELKEIVRNKTMDEI